MIRAIKNEQHLSEVVAGIGGKPFKVIITSPSTCAPCRRLEELIRDKETDEEVLIVDVFKEKYTAPFIVDIKAVPTLIEVYDGKSKGIMVGVNLKDEIKWNN